MYIIKEWRRVKLITWEMSLLAVSDDNINVFVQSLYKKE